MPSTVSPSVLQYTNVFFVGHIYVLYVSLYVLKNRKCHGGECIIKCASQITLKSEHVGGKHKCMFHSNTLFSDKRGFWHWSFKETF